ILAMIAFTSNRCFNGKQLQNSLAFIACGVSERTNDYLHFIGLTSSRETGLKAMDTLGRASEKLIKSRMAKEYKLYPFMTLDNIDIQTRIHNTRIESTTKMFHGSYGYLHFLPDHLTKDIDPNEATADNLLKCVENSRSKPFEPASMLPDQKDENHWTLVLKSQLAAVLVEYEVTPNSAAHTVCKGSLSLVPPPVDQIVMYTPDLMMLKMMNASDNSASGVAEMLEQCQKQTDEDAVEFSKFLRVLEGDMGTCLNFESLVRQRFPAGHADEALANILNMPGLAHTLWNVASKVLSHHWGNSKDTLNTGVHRTAGALGMESDKLPSQQDFNSLMQVIFKSHTATLVFLLRYALSKFQ
ncbi:hypothetical protein DFH28DRAFT_913790, partial [Melampsora americana]